MLPYAPDATVGDILADDRELSTFNQLFRRAGVIKEVAGEGPFTIFAPTNAAFDALGPNGIGDVMQDPTRFRHVMEYHVAVGDYRAEGLDDVGSMPTLHGTPLAVITTDEGTAIGGGADILEADIEGANGVVHKISNVLMPE